MAKTTAILGLHVTKEHSDGYFHLYARPVYVGPRPSQLTDAFRQTVLPSRDEVQSLGMYEDETFNGLWLDGLKVRSQGADRDTPRHLYGFKVDFHEVYSVDLRKAQKMVKTLSTLDKRMEKLDQKFGRVDSFSAYLLRVAAALGATRLVISKERGRSEWNSPYVVQDLRQGAYEVDDMVSKWVTPEVMKEDVAS